VRKSQLCIKVKRENREFLKRLSEEKNRSVSNILDITITDLLNKYHERNKDNEKIT